MSSLSNARKDIDIRSGMSLLRSRSRKKRRKMKMKLNKKIRRKGLSLLALRYLISVMMNLLDNIYL